MRGRALAAGVAGSAFLALAPLSLAVPASAQAPGEGQPAFSPEDDLDCAIYVGALMAEMGAAMTPENRIGLTSAMTYFAGRYEARAGLDLAEAFAERIPIFVEADPIAIEQTCSIRMRAFGARLQRVGAAMDRLQAEEAARQSASETGQTPDP